MQPRDTGQVQRGEDRACTLETFAHGSRAAFDKRELERHGQAHGRIHLLREVDDAHAAAPDLTQ